MRRARRSLLTAAVVAIVAGIIGMHALTTHGAMAATDHASMTAAMGSPATMTADDSETLRPHGIDAAATATVSGVSVAGPRRGMGGMGDMNGMVMLCGFMITAAAATLLLFLLAWRLIPVLPTRRRSAAATLRRLVTTHHETGPPPVWEFSVIRC